ncbi:hypothetical protein LCGC14_3000700, partial [marine sediment metagenome]
MEIFVDGVSDGTNGTAYTPGTGSKILTWGSIDGTQDYFRGDLDNIRIWNDIRTDAEIFDNAQIEVSPQANLIGNWNMNEGSGSTAADNSGGGRNATLQPIWTDNHLQLGRAHVYVRIKWNKKKFSTGLPTIQFDVKGRKLLDPRTDQAVVSVTPATDFIEVTAHGLVANNEIQFTTDDTLPVPLLADTVYWVRNETANTFKVALSPGGTAIDITTSGVGNHTIVSREFGNNPALCVIDFLMDASYGFGVPYERVDVTTLSAAANACDELVTLDVGGSEKRYTCNGVVFADSTPKKIIEQLLNTMAGQLVYAGSRWYTYAGVWRTPTVTFDENDVVGTLNVRTMTSRQSSFNAVNGIYQDLGNNH